ncbi:hypothetical protein Q3G72_035212 [Acer saccharum]|nr:hypothetical protein Q3G72_035212 [Acer saccharum]
MNSTSHCGIKRQAREPMMLFFGIIMLFAFRCFQIVHAPIFLHSFDSNRRHERPCWELGIAAEPPSYEPIVAEDKTVHNLNEYIEIGAENISTNSTNVGTELINDVSNKKLGVVMNENQLEEFFSQVS